MGLFSKVGEARNSIGIFCAAKRPLKILIVVPDSFAKSVTLDFLGKYIPCPVMVRELSFPNFTFIPSLFRQSKVAIVSLQRKNGFILVAPLQSEEKITARWDIDLSAGIFIVAFNFFIGFILGIL